MNENYTPKRVSFGRTSTAQDTIERGDVHPKQRALAMRRLVGGAAVVASSKAGRAAQGRGKKP